MKTKSLRVIIIVVVLLLAICGSIIASTYIEPEDPIGQEDPPIVSPIEQGVPIIEDPLLIEDVSLRTETSKTYTISDNLFRMVVYAGPVHYKNNYKDIGEEWKDIDLTWDGKHLDTAPYTLSVEGGVVVLMDKKTGDSVTITSLNGAEIVPTYKGIRLQRKLTSLLEASNTYQYNVAFKGDSIQLVCSAVDAKEEPLPVEYSYIKGVLTEKIVSLTTSSGKAAEYPITLDPTFQPGVAGKDSCIDTRYPTTVFGTYTYIKTGWQYYGIPYYEELEAKGLVQFAVNWGVDIPVGATLTAATFSLYNYSNTGSATYYAYRLLRRDWVEAQATWNIYKTGSSWTTAGCGSNGNDYTTTDGASVAVAGTGWVNWNVLAQVQTAQSGSFDPAFRTSTTTVARFLAYSSDYVTDPTLNPKLVVTYTTGFPYSWGYILGA